MAARYRSRGRRTVLVLALIAMATGLVWRTFDLQFRQADRIVAWGEDHRIQTSHTMGLRGDILDRSGEPLATSLQWATVFADPSLVVDPLAEAQVLAPVLGTEAFPLAQKMAVPGQFVYLDRQVHPEKASEVENLGLPGIATRPEARRVYPLGDVATEIIGSVSDDHTGTSGIELLYNEVLAGAPGSRVREEYPGGRSVPGGINDHTPAVDGSDLRLTIDRLVQFEAGRILADRVRDTDAAGGVIVVGRPATGEILAMTTATRDPDGEVVIGAENRALTWAFEPGSVIKGLTFSAVLDSGLATPETIRPVPDRLIVHDSEFTDYSPHPTRGYSVRDIVVESSNIGTILWAQHLGETGLDDYLRRFGIGGGTGLGLFGESAGLMPSVSDWSGTSLATIAIGQGVSLTPLQLLLAFNTIANDGVYVPARIVAEVIAPDGESMVPPPTSDPHRVVSVAAATHMRRILREVVAGGTGKRAEVENYEVAGKTGTARKPLPEGGYKDAAGNYRYVAAFAGFAPAGSPEISIVVVIDEPTSTIYGGSAAAPAFAELARITLRRLKVPPPGQRTDDLILASSGGGDGDG
jgi:cell division protein FtsI (penicillin-binding protein 3)